MGISFTARDFLSRTVPPAMRRIGRELIDLPERLAYRKRLAAGAFELPKTGPVLSYGGVLHGNAGGMVHGGAVKLIHLNERPWRLLAAGTHHDSLRVTSAIECAKHLVDCGCDVELVIAGRLAWRGADAMIAAMIQNLGLANVVRLVPAFTQAEAVGLYQQ